MFSEINFFHVLLAGLAALVVGFVWYLPPVLGKRWAGYVNEYVGIPQQEVLTPSNPARDVAFWLVTTLVNALVLAYLLETSGADNLLSAMGIAAAVWVGLGLTFSSWPVIFARQSTGLWLLNNGAFLLMQVVMAVVLVVLK